MIIIGAGAAGLAAARVLREAERSVIVIEASQRIGGRAHTDTATFGAPCDTGAHWLHYGNCNPFKHYAESINAADLYQTPSDTSQGYVVFNPDVPGDRYTQAEVDQFWDKWGNAETSLRLIGSQHDLSPQVSYELSGAINTAIQDPWFASIALMFGAWDMGKDWTDYSNRDYWRSPAIEANFHWMWGYGALVQQSGQDIDVQFGTRAQRVTATWDGVSVETDQGTITARACIVTVSSGVITSGTLQIDDMAPDLLQAFHDVPMGTYNRIALQFTEDVFNPGSASSKDKVAFTRVADLNGGRPHGIVFTTNALGTNIVYGDVGGQNSANLEGDGPDAMVAYALDEIVSMLGNDVLTKYTQKSLATRWLGDPLFCGAYASPLPGKAHQRAKLVGATTGERIFYAGEAHHSCEWATVGGAHKSGCDAAQRVLNQLFSMPTDSGRCNVVGALPDRPAAPLLAACAC